VDEEEADGDDDDGGGGDDDDDEVEEEEEEEVDGDDGGGGDDDDEAEDEEEEEVEVEDGLKVCSTVLDISWFARRLRSRLRRLNVRIMMMVRMRVNASGETKNMFREQENKKRLKGVWDHHLWSARRARSSGL
jgi:hypothetical protein